MKRRRATVRRSAYQDATVGRALQRRSWGSRVEALVRDGAALPPEVTKPDWVWLLDHHSTVVGTCRFRGYSGAQIIAAWQPPIAVLDVYAMTADRDNTIDATICQSDHAGLYYGHFASQAMSYAAIPGFESWHDNPWELYASRSAEKLQAIMSTGCAFDRLMMYADQHASLLSCAMRQVTEHGITEETAWLGQLLSRLPSIRIRPDPPGRRVPADLLARAEQANQAVRSLPPSGTDPW